jgi:predicted heme/steroid binding protein
MGQQCQLQAGGLDLVERVNRKREHMPELFTSDFQVGEVIRASETEAGYGYDPRLSWSATAA